MAESKGWAKALRRVTRAGAVSTSSPGRAPSNMRDWVATLGIHFYTGGGEKEGESRKSKVERKHNAETRTPRGALSGNCEGIRSAGGQEGWGKRDSQKWLSQKLAYLYFLVERSTRPAVSTSFCLPVKKGWQLEQISTRSMSPLIVERVWIVWKHAQCTVTGW